MLIIIFNLVYIFAHFYEEICDIRKKVRLYRSKLPFAFVSQCMKDHPVHIKLNEQMILHGSIV